MTLKRAITILKSEMKFLGVSLGMLESLIETQPGAFSSETITAHRRYLDHRAWVRLQDR